jgi:hypothetical protein
MSESHKKTGDAPVSKRRKYIRTQANPTVAFGEEEGLASTTPNAHYHMSNDTRHKTNISEWLGDHQDDPALKVSFFAIRLGVGIEEMMACIRTSYCA